MNEEITEASGDRDVNGDDSGPRAPLPPTAAASVPSLTEETVSTESGRSSSSQPSSGRRPAFGRYSTPSTEESSSSKPPLDRSVRPAIVGVVVAVGALITAEQLKTPLFVLLCWIVGFIGVITALISGNRARYRITNHPERRSGLLWAAVALVTGIILLIAMLGSLFLVVRSDPVGDAPILRSSSSIERLRWGYQRFRIVQGNGWHSVARDPGSCWEIDRDDRNGDGRDTLDRVEQPLRRISCGRTHSHEVLSVYSIEPRADVPYDEGEMLAEALERCRYQWGSRAPEDGTYVFEHPTAPAWERGDHDVACLLEATIEGSVRGR